MNTTIHEQIPMMVRTKKFMKKFGLKVNWVSEKTNIPDCRLSAWMNGNELLYANQFEKIKAFVEEYEALMSGFSYLKDGEQDEKH